MFNPPLDLGFTWQDIARGTSPSGVFGYTFSTALNFRADALSVAVTMADTTRTWVKAGHIVQLWNQNGFTYQVKFARVRLDNQTTIAIEPLEQSTLLFIPVDWLSNWTIDIKARPYQQSNIGSGDNQAVLDKLDQIEQATAAGFASNRTDLGEIAANNIEERLELITQLKEMDAGIYTLAEGFAEILSPEQGDRIKETTERRLNLDLGYI